MSVYTLLDIQLYQQPGCPDLYALVLVQWSSLRLQNGILISLVMPIKILMWPAVRHPSAGFSLKRGSRHSTTLTVLFHLWRGFKNVIKPQICFNVWHSTTLWFISVENPALVHLHHSLPGWYYYLWSPSLLTMLRQPPNLDWGCHKSPYVYCQEGGTYHMLSYTKNWSFVPTRNVNHPHAYSTMLARWCDKEGHSIHQTSYMQH